MSNSLIITEIGKDILLKARFCRFRFSRAQSMWTVKYYNSFLYYDQWAEDIGGYRKLTQKLSMISVALIILIIYVNFILKGDSNFNRVFIIMQ